MYSVYEIICLDRGSTPLTSTFAVRVPQSTIKLVKIVAT